jgi:phosphohistidine phosphatase
MNVIKNLNDSRDILIRVGHNHAYTSIANMLGDTNIDNLPTSGYVILQFEEDSWKDISFGKTIQTIFPRDLK